MMKDLTCMASKQTKSFFLAALWLVAFTSAVARSCAGAATRGRRGNRLSVGDHLAISASSGFATVCIMAFASWASVPILLLLTVSIFWLLRRG